MRTLFLAAMLGAPLAAAAATAQIEVETEAGKPLAGAVVFLESREARAAAKPAQGVEIAQVARQFSPQVTVVPIGTSVQFPNRDTVRHHVYSFSPTKNFELKLYAGKDANPVLFDKPGIAVLGCNIHDNMAAWVVVVETPYYGQSGANGRATLDNVPAGNYRLRVWHAGLPVGAPAQDLPLALAATGSMLTVRLPGVKP
ncbi:MAG TPA: methylamine utilization protein [Burkholderiaceae bacterium]|nr:methylamine utilization protein [Burkholderiaceae bacterium]